MFHIGFKIRELGLIIEKYLQYKAIQCDLEHLEGPQGAVLFYLISHEDQDVFQKDIEQLLNIQKASASGLIKRMEKNGFIHVQPLESDKRFKAIKVTDEGKAKHLAIENFLKQVEADLSHGISQEEFKIFHNVIKKVTQNAQVESEEKQEGEYEC